MKRPPALRPYPSKAFIELTSRCNFRCAICARQGESRPASEGDMEHQLFVSLVSGLADAEAVVFGGLGEPLLHVGAEEFIHEARKTIRPDGWVGLQSNGSLIDQRRAVSLVRAGLDKICISVDSSSPAGYGRMREGGHLAQVECAMDALAKAKRTHAVAVDIGVELVLQRDNLDDLPAAVRWASRHGAGFMLVSHLIPFRRGLASEVLYDTTLEEAVMLFAQYAAAATRGGVDLLRYHDVFMKYRQTPDERSIVRLVEEMVSEGHRRALALNLRKMFALDPAAAERVKTVFRRAESIAREAGVRLMLPEVLARSRRKCPFVEDGSVFVSWDGSVHPCHFLWHGGRCFVHGVEQTVQRRTFGKLPEVHLLDLWNDPAFASFRAHVHLHRYPFCFDCGFALCDYVCRGEFEQDCWTNEEPCGACLWGTGLFQCLS